MIDWWLDVRQMDFCVVGVPEKGVLVQDFLDSLTVPDYAPGYDPIGESRQREKVFLTARKEVGGIVRLHIFIFSWVGVCQILWVSIMAGDWQLWVSIIAGNWQLWFSMYSG